MWLYGFFRVQKTTKKSFSASTRAVFNKSTPFQREFGGEKGSKKRCKYAAFSSKEIGNFKLEIGEKSKGKHLGNIQQQVLQHTHNNCMDVWKQGANGEFQVLVYDSGLKSKSQFYCF